MELAGKKVLITGAAKRVGAALAQGFADAGCDLIVHYRSSQREAEALAADCEKRGVHAHTMQADLCDLIQTRALAQQVLNDHGSVDILINNASLFYPQDIADVSDEDWETFLGIHVRAPFVLAQTLAPAMQRRGTGRIINLADWRGFKPEANYVPYSVSKGALLTLNQALAKAYAPEVLVNAICPGPILPTVDDDPANITRVEERTLLKRWGEPQDVVELALYLARQDYSTGREYFVDGGESL